jgi:hypothetical protein
MVSKVEAPQGEPTDSFVARAGTDRRAPDGPHLE